MLNYTVHSCQPMSNSETCYRGSTDKSKYIHLHEEVIRIHFTIPTMAGEKESGTNTITQGEAV